MSSDVRVVTDSTASIPDRLIAELGIGVVPLHVLINGVDYLEGVSCTPDQVARALTSGSEVTTSQPGPEQFNRMYGELAADGATGIVSVHLSQALSGTFATARIASDSAKVQVVPIDSGTAAMALGFAVVAAATAARAGTDLEQVAHIARSVTQGARAFFLVDSLEHLHRGGRLGYGAAVVGTVLGLKPLLTVKDGGIELVQKVRTRRGAIDRLLELTAAAAVQYARPGIAVHHIDDEDSARQLAARLTALTGTEVLVSPVSAVLGAHVGPGLLATAVADHSHA